METYLYTKSRGCPALLLCVCTAAGKPLLVFWDSDHVSTKAREQDWREGLGYIYFKKGQSPVEDSPSESRRGRKYNITKRVPFPTEANNPRRLKVGNLGKS